MKTTVKKSIEIPAKRHPKKNVGEKLPGSPVERSFHLTINLWIFRYEYYREQSDMARTD